MNLIYRSLFIITIITLILLALVIYKDRQFQSNPLSNTIIEKLNYKNNNIKQRIKQVYKTDINIPILIEEQLPNNLFGLASYKKGVIKIYLNKKRFQESEDYMINYVLPHEYAHALMFYFGDFSMFNGGHTKKWQQICINIGGIKCDRFVDHNDILIEKLGGIY